MCVAIYNKLNICTDVINIHWVLNNTNYDIDQFN